MMILYNNNHDMGRTILCRGHIGEGERERRNRGIKSPSPSFTEAAVGRPLPGLKCRGSLPSPALLLHTTANFWVAHHGKYTTCRLVSVLFHAYTFLSCTMTNERTKALKLIQLEHDLHDPCSSPRAVDDMTILCILNRRSAPRWSSISFVQSLLRGFENRQDSCHHFSLSSLPCYSCNSSIP